MYKWLKGNAFAPPVTSLVLLHIMTTTSMQDMVALLTGAWRPINCKYAAARRSGTLQNFCAAMGTT